MPQGRSYCFIKCQSETDAIELYDKIHGRFKATCQNTPLYLTYTESGILLINAFLIYI